MVDMNKNAPISIQNVSEIATILFCVPLSNGLENSPLQFGEL